MIDQRAGHPVDREIPPESDDYSIETWEESALRLAGGRVFKPEHALLQVYDKPVLLSRRFDRDNGCIFLSVCDVDDGARDGGQCDYPELVDALTAHGAAGQKDARRLPSSWHPMFCVVDFGGSLDATTGSCGQGRVVRCFRLPMISIRHLWM